MALIAVTSGEEQYRFLHALAGSGRSDLFTLPKTSAPGDDIVFYISAPRQAFVATATVVDEPGLGRDRNWPDYYSAAIGNVKMLAREVSRLDMLRMAPEWRWPNAPLNRTTVDEAAAPAVLGALRRAGRLKATR